MSTILSPSLPLSFGFSLFAVAVSHTTTVSGDEKSLASKLVWKGKSWRKVAVGGEGLISCVLGVKVRWFCSSYLGLLDPIFVVQVSFTRSFCVASTDYQRFLASLKLKTSQVVQIARQLTGRICPVRAQRVKCCFRGIGSEKSEYLPWMKPFLTLGGWQLERCMYWNLLEALNWVLMSSLDCCANPSPL